MTRPPSTETSATSSPKSRPTTRSSFRQSLNLAGKALVDVINKDTKDADKSSRKGKDVSSRRLSAIGLKQPAAPRASMGDTKSPLQASRARTPDSKTITRRRISNGTQGASTDSELPSKLHDNAGGAQRTSALRPRTNTTSSALPKYRPKSVMVEKPPSPKTGTRRPLSNSEDEKDYRNQNKNKNSSSPMEKISRPISPLPQRAALKISTAVNATPPVTPTKATSSIPASSRSSPQRPSKLVKTVASVSASVGAGIPRPPSSSSSSSFTPHTPKTPQSKNLSAVRRAAQASPSPRPASINNSPLARPSRLPPPRNGSPSPLPASAVGNMSHISEVDSEDSEAEDVALLLAPVAAISAPTPAMPRIQVPRNRRRLAPQTPTRSNFLPTRENMSYLSPLPPDSESSGRSSLRPPKANNGAKQARGSILSWEQIASEASKTLGEDEIENMLSDMPAPFHPGAVSPTPSTIQLDIPESPCLSTLSSPGGYGSISQVLLPEVTPSPAVHHMQRYDMVPDVPNVDAATVTLLRLQLASAENLAKERLSQLQNMEEEVHNLKTVRGREAQELMKQVVHMEEQLQGSLRIREQNDEERLAHISELKNQLRQAHELRDQAVQEAIHRRRRDERAARDAALRSQRVVCEVDCLARVAVSEWESVHMLAELELDLVRGDRQVLSVLLKELDELSRPVL